MIAIGRQRRAVESAAQQPREPPVPRLRAPVYFVMCALLWSIASSFGFAEERERTETEHDEETISVLREDARGKVMHLRALRAKVQEFSERGAAGPSSGVTVPRMLPRDLNAAYREEYSLSQEAADLEALNQIAERRIRAVESQLRALTVYLRIRADTHESTPENSGPGDDR